MDKVAEFKDRLIIAMNKENKRPMDIVNETGIKKSAFSQYMSGKIVPKTDRLYLIANCLDVDETWLMGMNVPMERKPRILNGMLAKKDFELLESFYALSEDNQLVVKDLIASLLKTQH